MPGPNIDPFPAKPTGRGRFSSFPKLLRNVRPPSMCVGGCVDWGSGRARTKKNNIPVSLNNISIKESGQTDPNNFEI